MLETDLSFLNEGVIEMDHYLLSNELYWPIEYHTPSGNLPSQRLTLGALLLTQCKLNAYTLNSSQQAELNRLLAQLISTRQKWRVAWAKKALKEFQARLNLWRDFLNDYRADPAGNIDRYPYEVQRRVMLQLLADELDQIPPNEQELLSGLDKLLLAVFMPGNFVWEAVLEKEFPKTKFWYLYGSVKAS
jgi:hypothetical protein